MMTILSLTGLLGLLATALLIMGGRAYRNHLEIRRLERNGCRKLAFRRAGRGCVDVDFLRCMAELTLLLLLLASVFGWLGHQAPR
jgi:hypothetical protein